MGLKASGCPPLPPPHQYHHHHHPYPRVFCTLLASRDQDGGPSNSTIDINDITEKQGTVKSLNLCCPECDIRPRLITLAETLIIPYITKTSSNYCLIIRACRVLTYCNSLYRGRFQVWAFGLCYVRYIGEFVISRFVISTFYSIHFTVTLAGTQNIVRHIEKFAKQRLVKSRLHAINILTLTQLSRSVWLDLCRVHRPYCVRSVLTTSVKTSCSVIKS